MTPVSGRYAGGVSAPASSSEWIELRVDVDARFEHDCVTHRLSGDLFEDGRHRASWIVDAPQVVRDEAGVEITGTARFWHPSEPPATLRVRIDPDARDAAVVWTPDERPDVEYVCARVGDEFRHLELQIDVCRTAGTELRLPEYDLAAHENRPRALALRRLTVASAFRDAGIALTVRQGAVLDPPEEGPGWSNARLDATLDVRLTGGVDTGPRWCAWGLLAGRHEDPRNGGLMFSTRAPARRGFAIFRDHPWFALLPSGEPRDDLQAAAARKYLFTWVHEIGHLFNLVHSSEKGRPDSSSWMNHDGEYDARHGSGRFWSMFRFGFDEQELIHLRHGNLPSVAMGGEAFRAGGHLRANCRMRIANR